MSGLRAATGYAVALILTLMATGAIALIRLDRDVTNASMLYILVVLCVAVLYGTRPALAASLLSFLSFNFFFVEPRYTLRVQDFDSWISLVLLLITGVVTGRLAAALRDRARDAERREREAVVLYDVARLIAGPNLVPALEATTERVRRELGVEAVLVSLRGGTMGGTTATAGDPEAVALAKNAAALPDRLLEGGAAPTGEARGSPGRWVRVVSPAKGGSRNERVRGVPISSRGERAGTLVVVSQPGTAATGPEQDRLLAAVANQIGMTLERLELQLEANEADVLRRTDELRTALMQAVSHDLRTPLSAIIASAGSLLQDDVAWTDDDRRQFLRTIEAEARRLNRLVGNLLDMSRIEAGILRPEKGWYELGSLIREVAGRLELIAGPGRLSLDVPDEMPPLLFDYMEIDQVLTNLIENAIRHTPPESEIHVVARMTASAVRVEVIDTGPGIPKEALPRLFEPFYRGGAGRGAPQGSGLGLAVAKGLVAAHGGTLRGENRPEGGAHFVLELPITGDVPAESPLPA